MPVLGGVAGGVEEGGVEAAGGRGAGAVDGGAGGGGGRGSEPIGAKGLLLPSLPSGTRVMLESCREKKALSAKIASSNFILFTERSRVRKSLAIKELSLEAVVT